MYLLIGFPYVCVKCGEGKHTNQMARHTNNNKIRSVCKGCATIQLKYSQQKYHNNNNNTGGTVDSNMILDTSNNDNITSHDGATTTTTILGDNTNSTTAIIKRKYNNTNRIANKKPYDLCSRTTKATSSLCIKHH
jgi:hypothetical protein